MATLKPVMPFAPGTHPAFPEAEQLELEYDARRDVLFLSIESPPPAVSVDLDDGAWMRIVRETGQIVGYEVEDFQAVFLCRHPQLAAAWAVHQPQAAARSLGEALHGATSDFVPLLQKNLLERAAQRLSIHEESDATTG